MSKFSRLSLIYVIEGFRQCFLEFQLHLSLYLDALRLGRETDWKETEGAPVRGIGQRVFMVGEEAIPLMDLGNITFGA